MTLQQRVQMRVVVMNNLFQNQSGLAMHRKYDLKGSTQARCCSFLLNKHGSAVCTTNCLVLAAPHAAL